MNSFKLSDEVNKNKIFLVNLNDLNNRLDPYYYREKFDFSNCIKLKKIVKIKGGKRLPKYFSYSEVETNYLYLRVSDIKDEIIDYSNMKFISKKVFDILANYEIKQNDLIFTIAGSIGKVQIVENIPQNKKIILTENAVNIKPNNKILSRYLYLILQTTFLQKQIDINYIQTTIPKIGLDRIENLYIPNLPSINKQKEIIQLYDFSIKQKQQKEKQAQKLLNSINEYLLNKLGIILNKIDNTLKDRIFQVTLSEVTGNRLDPFYYKYCNKSSKSEKYDEFSIGELAYIQKGDTITSKEVIQGDYPVIAGGKTSPYNHNKYNYKGNIITISASGAYAGYVWYHDYPIFASDCNVLYSKNENKILTKFIFEVLKLKQQELYNLQQGSGQPHVYAKDIKKIKIPLPKIEQQEEIVKYIQNVRDKAKQLQKEALRDLKNNKIKIEKMILGS